MEGTVVAQKRFVKSCRSKVSYNQFLSHSQPRSNLYKKLELMQQSEHESEYETLNGCYTVHTNTPPHTSITRSKSHRTNQKFSSSSLPFHNFLTFFPLSESFSLLPLCGLALFALSSLRVTFFLLEHCPDFAS